MERTVDTEQRSNNSADEDPLAFARGFLFALLISLPFWLCVGLVIYLEVK